MISLLKPVHSQDINHWDIKITAEKDTIESGEKYTAYLSVKNKNIDNSSIEVLVHGASLKKDSSGKFIYQVIGMNFQPALTYKKIDQQFKIKCPYINIKDTTVRYSYYVKYKNSVEEDQVILYTNPMPEFIASRHYPTFNDYIVNKIKAKKVTAKGTLFVQFIVTKEGTLKYEQLIRGDIDLENLTKIIDIFNNSPEWSPGEEYGRKVNVRKVIPIKFN
ncbi:tonb family protein [Sporocytophaga myxococcoides]|uniref:Tonb family protein n=2 Tax=Sporocytophaga myxococcoides TaxID=153721 RepID=A0A098LEM4_9BACT|nr:tonb family protein [Sporocytophaga myxococcoides]